MPVYLFIPNTLLLANCSSPLLVLLFFFHVPVTILYTNLCFAGNLSLNYCNFGRHHLQNSNVCTWNESHSQECHQLYAEATLHFLTIVILLDEKCLQDSGDFLSLKQCSQDIGILPIIPSIHSNEGDFLHIDF